jgi:hypothetical protein
VIGVVPTNVSAAPPVSNVPAADQYRESVPTSGGPKAPGAGDSDGERPISRGAQAKLDQLGERSEQTADQLEQVSTKGDFGAPQRRLEGTDKAASEPTASGSLASSVGGGGIGWAWLVLAAITAAVIGAAGYRKRRTAPRD